MGLDHSERRREVPLRRLIPNVITTAALCCGLASLHFSIREEWNLAILAILFSAIFDALDGRAARLLRVTSKFGEVLDSLSDFLSFGVAPAMLIYKWLLASDPTPSVGRAAPDDVLRLAAVTTFALCSAMRLARFTSATTEAATAMKANPKLGNYFTGMPTPAAGGAVLIPVMVETSKHTHWRPPEWLAIALAFLIAFLMVSRVAMFSFKKLRVAKGWVAPILILVGLTVVCMVKDVWLTLAGLAGLYLLSLPLSVVMHRRVVGAEREGAPTGSGADGSEVPGRTDAAESAAGVR